MLNLHRPSSTMPSTKEQTDEHPIIFSGWSIRRILAAQKSQTRRIVNPQPPGDVRSVMWDDMGGDWIDTVGFRSDPILWNEKCPYGKPGDVIWVRETFRVPSCYDGLSPSDYISGDRQYTVRYEANGEIYTTAPDEKGALEWGRKRSSIFMPRELCRLRLRVESVRVERLQEISHHAAEAEGVRVCNPQETPRDLFRMKWNEIHGTGAWDENPFVWCVEFSRIDTE